MFRKKKTTSPPATTPPVADGEVTPADQSAKPVKPKKAPEPPPLIWGQGQLNQRKFFVGAPTEKEVREWLNSVCKRYKVDPTKAKITVKRGRYGEMWKYKGFTGVVILPKPEKKVEPKAPATSKKGTSKKGDGKKPEPVTQSADEITRLEQIAKTHGVTFERPHSFFGPDLGKVTTALQEAFPGAAMTFDSAKRGGTLGLGGKLVQVGTATPVAGTSEGVAASEAQTADGVPIFSIPTVTVDSSADGDSKPGATNRGKPPQEQPAISADDRRKMVTERRKKGGVLIEWIKPLFEDKYSSFEAFFTALVAAAEKAAKGRSPDTAGSFRLLAWYAAAAVLAAGKPKDSKDPSFETWVSAAQDFLNHKGASIDLGKVLFSSAYSAALALRGVRGLLSKPELFAKPESIGLANTDGDGDAPKKVDPQQILTDAVAAGRALDERIHLDLPTESSEGLAVMIDGLLKLFDAAVKGQGVRTRVAAVLVVVNVAVPPLEHVFGETKGPSGEEGDDLTIAAVHRLLTGRPQPQLAIKPDELAVSMLRAVGATFKSDALLS